MGSVCSWYHRSSGNALFRTNSGRAMSGLFPPSTLALVFSVNLHFTQQCFHKIHNKGAAIRRWRNIQPSWFASFDVKIHRFPHNFQGTLSHVVFVHIKSAGGQVVLSQIHGMKGLQGLEKFVEPGFEICLSHSIPTLAGVREPWSSPMGTPSQENSQHSSSMKEVECLLIHVG